MNVRPPRSRRPAALIAVAGLAVPLLVFARPALAAPATLPQVPAAGAASRYLGAQLTSGGYLVGPDGSKPDGSGTATVALALAATGSAPQQMDAAVRYLEANVNSIVADTSVTPSADNPGRLALLILVGHAAGIDPRAFGGTDLVARLLATARTSGTDTGLFGAADPTYDGAYRQGLSLAALGAAGVTTANTTAAAAVLWLQRQECPGASSNGTSNGGWTSYRANIATACPSPDPTTFAGADTNSTALAMQGLVAEGTSVSPEATGFLRTLQDADAGWGAFGSPTDADSTSLVIQALLATNQSPSSFAKGSADPVDALDALQIHGGPADGALAFTPNADHSLSPSALATEQAAPALAGLPFGFGPQRSTTNAYRMFAGDGGVFTFNASFHGSAGGVRLVKPVVGGASTPDGTGYYLAAADGGVFAYHAPFRGSLGNVRLNAPIVGMSVDAANGGYWLVGADGGVFTFATPYLGGTGADRLNQPMVAMSPTPNGAGYILIAADGGVFTYGNAHFSGSLGNLRLNAPIVGGAIDPATGGYWLVAADGGVFTFNAPFLGSAGNLKLTHPVVGMAATDNGQGYELVASDGSLYPFGTATQAGGLTGLALSAPVVGVATSPPGA